MHPSQYERQRDATLLARLLLADGDHAHPLTGPSEAERQLDERASLLTRSEGVLASLGLTDIDAPSRTKITRAFEIARMLWPHLEVPLIDEFVAQGTQRATFDAALRADDTLSVVLAPNGLGADAWRRLFGETPGAPALVLSTEVRDEFALLEWPLDRPTVGVVPVTGEPSLAPPAYWSLAIIPAADHAPLMGQNQTYGPHPLIAELLTLQLGRVADGLDPLDARTFTWIEGRIGEGKLAARHIFDPGDNTIRVSTREWAQQGPHQGARPPVR